MAEGMDGTATPGPAPAAPQVQQQPQFTKRKQFLGFKIRSKPINPQAGPKQASPKKEQKSSGPRLRRPEPLEWIVSLAIAAAVAVVTRDYGFSVIQGAVATVATYVVIFSGFAAYEASMAQAHRKQAELISVLTGKKAPAQAAPAASAKPPKATARPVIREAGEKRGPLANYINSIIKGRRNLESDLRGVDIRKSPYEFVKSMMVYALVMAVAVTLMIVVLLEHFAVEPQLLILAPAMGFAIYMAMFNRFLMFPAQKNKVIGKNVERDILFAARDVVIGMRSGMPLYNAITAVSTGYGDTSKEFSRIVELVQLGMPIEQAMEETSAKSESKTFKRLMLQASVSIKAGVDVTGALQDVVDDVAQERIIDLRRYGQKLNALAMFYMLFGVIFPSMGIAVATIMSTFINIFPVTYVVLVLALIFIAFVQLVLLNIMRTSRPVFTL